jgi:pyruvate-formate lyase-activating enzyme
VGAGVIPSHEDPEVHTFLRADPAAQVAWLRARGLPDAVLLPMLNACAQRCVFCAGPGTSDLPASANSPAEAARRHLQARPHDVTRLLIGGNEPTLHPAFEEMLLAARVAGYTRIDLLTNGVTLTTNAAAWAALGLHEVVVPLYADDATTHDAIAGVTCFVRVLEGLDAAVAAGVRVRVHTLALRPTLPRLPALADLVAHRYGDRLHVGLLREKPGSPWSALAVPLGHVRGALRGLDVGLVGAPACLRWGDGDGVAPSAHSVAADAPALLAELYFRTQARGYAAPCRDCSARAACPGVVAAYLSAAESTHSAET